jgi:hypothetical protein
VATFSDEEYVEVGPFMCTVTVMRVQQRVTSSDLPKAEFQIGEC